MSHGDILSPSAPRPQWQPWSSDALERGRHTALLIGFKWALHGPVCHLVSGPLMLIQSEPRLARIAPLNAASPDKMTFLWHIGCKHFVKDAHGRPVSLWLWITLTIWSSQAYDANSATAALTNIIRGGYLVLSISHISLTLLNIASGFLGVRLCRWLIMLEAFQQI